jgi:hypothetical protein
MSGGSAFFVPVGQSNGVGVNGHGAGNGPKGTRLQNILNSQTAPPPPVTPPVVPPPPVVAQTPPSTVPTQPDKPKTKMITLTVDTDHAWFSTATKYPSAKVALKQALKNAGHDENTEVHVAEVRVTKTTNSTNLPLNAVHYGLSGPQTVASRLKFDSNGDPITEKILPGEHYVPREHQVIYTNPIRGPLDLVAKHADVNVRTMKKGLTLAPGTDQYVVWPGNNPKLYQMLLDNEGKIDYGRVGGKAPHITVSESALDNFFVDYDKNVQSNFTRVSPDELSVELRHQSIGPEDKWGQKIAELQMHDSERDAFKNPKAKPAVSGTYEYDLYPLGSNPDM